MIKMNNLRNILILSVLASLFFTTPALSADVTFEGEDGPVSARMQVYNGWPVLEISYRGYLFECGAWSYGRMPVTVNIVYVANDEHGKTISHMHAMTGICQNYWNANDSEEAYTRIGTTDQGGILKHILRHQNLNGDTIHLELAFVRNGRWDSRYGENYHITLERSDAPE